MKNRVVDKKKMHRFTLVELLVSMGILVVILGFILQFFVSSQKVWTSMSQRNRVYADARVGMDVMTSMLQNMFYSDGGIPFYINDETSGDNKIYFATRTMQNLPGGPLKYVSFQRGTGSDVNILKIAVFCDKDAQFGNYFPPYGLAGITKLSDARRSLVEDRFNAALLANDEYTSALVKRVIAFDVIPYERKDSVSAIDKMDFPPTPGSDSIEIPFLVELRLTLLSPEKEKEWMQIWKDKSDSDSGRKDFLNENSYTFSRTVFLGEQSRLNIN